MATYADTSYLVSLYTFDSNTAAAVAYDQQALSSPILISFGRFELQNAIRLKVFRHEITPQQAVASLADIEHDVATGAMMPAKCDWELVLAEAERLSQRFTTLAGHRGMDVLHVAASLILGAQDFLTFDGRQAALAKQAELGVVP